MPRKADYTLYVNVNTEDLVVEDVHCKIHLPKKVTDSIELRFLPTPEQFSAMQYAPEFAIEGEIKESDGFVSTRIRSDKVYRLSSSTSYYPSNITEEKIIGTPRDLEIEHLNYCGDSIIETSKTTGRLWLTKSDLLAPGKTLEPSHTGEVSVNLFKKLDFKLENGLQLAFDTHYRYKRDTDGTFTMFPELVAEFEFEGSKSEIHPALKHVDDFLTLVSFAERRRCVCLGWDASDSLAHVQYFRREMAIPDPHESNGLDLPLIEKKDFDEFIRTVYDSFIEIEQNDLIREALHALIPHASGTIESNFLSLCSALESAVLHFRRQNDLEYIFGSKSKDWKKLKDDLKNFIESHELLERNDQSRKLICRKLEELKRIPFGTAFVKLINNHSIRLDDLWPVSNRRGGACLSDIRNMLAHGEVFDPTQSKSLMVATEHLRWTVERILLTLLGWDISRSYVRPEFLSTRIEFNKKWKHDRELLSRK